MTGKIINTQASINAIVAAGGRLPRWIGNMDAKTQRGMIKMECRKLEISPVYC
jgi:hypothetical protein